MSSPRDLGPAAHPAGAICLPGAQRRRGLLGWSAWEEGKMEPSHGNGEAGCSLGSSVARSCPKGTRTPPPSRGVTKVSPGKRRFLRGQEVRPSTLGWGEVGLCRTGPGQSTLMARGGRGREGPPLATGSGRGARSVQVTLQLFSLGGGGAGGPGSGGHPGQRPSGSGPTLMWAGSQPPSPLAAIPWPELTCGRKGRGWLRKPVAGWGGAGGGCWGTEPCEWTLALGCMKGEGGDRPSHAEVGGAREAHQ